MDNTEKWFAVFMIVLFIGGSYLIITPSPEQKEVTNGYKLDNCIKYVNEIVPDPNDTAERSKLLEECFNK